MQTQWMCRLQEVPSHRLPQTLQRWSHCRRLMKKHRQTAGQQQQKIPPRLMQAQR